jgi:hypothetical protein
LVSDIYVVGVSDIYVVGVSDIYVVGVSDIYGVGVSDIQITRHSVQKNALNTIISCTTSIQHI